MSPMLPPGHGRLPKGDTFEQEFMMPPDITSIDSDISKSPLDFNILSSMMLTISLPSLRQNQRPYALLRPIHAKCDDCWLGRTLPVEPLQSDYRRATVVSATTPTVLPRRWSWPWYVNAIFLTRVHFTSQICHTSFILTISR